MVAEQQSIRELKELDTKYSLSDKYSIVFITFHKNICNILLI